MATPEQNVGLEPAPITDSQRLDRIAATLDSIKSMIVFFAVLTMIGFLGDIFASLFRH